MLYSFLSIWGSLGKNDTNELTYAIRNRFTDIEANI